MPPRDALGLLRDVIDAAEPMRTRTDGMSRERSLGNADIQVILERRFEVIGEALDQRSNRRPDLRRRIRHAQDAVGFRDIVMHAGAAADHEIVRHGFHSSLVVLPGDERVLHGELDDG